MYIQKSFTWDMKKEEINLTKHNISFEYASKAFSDYHSIIIPSKYNSSSMAKEARYMNLGKVEENVLIVIFTMRKDKNGKEIIRIISAKQASKKEREIYSRFPY